MAMPPSLYRIQVKGQLRPEWSDWFGGMSITAEENGDTTISGPVADQPALHALLVSVRDLGLTLVSLNHIEMHEHPKEES